MKSKKNNQTFLIFQFLILFLLCGCKKEDSLLVTTNLSLTSITGTSATCGGVVSGSNEIVITARGVCWSTSTPTINDSLSYDGQGYGAFTSVLRNLRDNTTYHVRAYINYSGGTMYGNEITFTTTKLPTVTTTAVTKIGVTKVTCGGSVTDDGGQTITDKGICWSTSNSPTISENKLSDMIISNTFTDDITGLLENTAYYIRAYATNSAGTAYGNVIKFSTLPSSGTVQDIDGNTYNYITIGTQTWMIENLKTTKYRDNTAISLVTDNSWISLTSGAYCWYNNATTNKNTYGALYNWYAVKTGKLAPVGWHIPSYDEWATLENYISKNFGVSGSVAKALSANTNWLTSTETGAIGNNLSLNNVSGFTALPGGCREDEGKFYGDGYNGYWWSTYSLSIDYRAIYLYLSYNNSSLVTWYVPQYYGFSVRCVRD
jgi:uncharacterized protein (TIGR02145 family)